MGLIKNPVLEMNMHKLQQTFLKFYNHIKDIPLKNLRSDPVFYRYFKKSVIDDPFSIGSRPYQLAIEVAYSKRKFSQTELLEVFNNRISISDPLGIAGAGINIDSSTFYSYLQAYHMSKTTCFGKSSLDVQCTPSISREHMQSLSPEAKLKIRLTQERTGNSFSDLVIDGHSHDFKSGKYSNAKNHIIFFDFEEGWSTRSKSIRICI